MGRLSWVVGAVYRIIQGCYGADDLVLPVLELKLELKVSGWWTTLLGTANARVEQSIVMKGEEWQQMIVEAKPNQHCAIPRTSVHC